MPQYQIQIHTTAKRELQELADSLRERLTDELAAVAATRQPTSHASVKMIEGQRDLFRVRAGDARAICHLSKPCVLVLQVGRRKEVYDQIDSVDDRLADATA